MMNFNLDFWAICSIEQECFVRKILFCSEQIIFISETGQDIIFEQRYFWSNWLWLSYVWLRKMLTQR